MPSEERAARLLRTLEPPSDAALLEQWLGGLRRKQRRRRVLEIGLSGLSVACMLALGLLSIPRVTPPEHGTSQHELAGSLQLQDGSTIERGANSRIVLEEVHPRKVQVLLESGTIVSTVAPRADREFVVVAGAFRIVVVGTRFEVERQGERVRVRVERGTVRVLGSEMPAVLLHTGDERVFDPAERAANDDEPPAPLPEASAAPAASARELSAANDWRSLARRGVYAEAYRLIEKGGPRVVGDEVGDLLLAADSARLSGHPAAALPYLTRVLASHPRDARAPMAAFTRGRLLLNLGRASEAASAFEKALALGAQGSLRENALARAVEARGRAGDGARAAALAHDYVKEYPRGRWLASVRAYGGLDE